MKVVFPYKLQKHNNFYMGYSKKKENILSLVWVN